MTDSLFLQDIMNTPRSLADTVAFLDTQADAVARAVHGAGARRIVALGSGSSWFAAVASAYLHHAFATSAQTLVVTAPAGDFHLYPLPLSARDAIVAVSVSGETIDALTLLGDVRGRHTLVGITNNAEASLARLVDHVLPMQAGPSLVPTTTKTFVTSVATLDLLWLSLLAVQGVTAAEPVRDELRSLATSVARAIAQARAQVAAAAARLAVCERLFVLGVGPLFPLAQEAALVFKEIANCPAEAVQTREMAQGMLSVVDPTVGVIVLDPPGRSHEVARDIVAQCTALQATVLTIGPTSSDLRIAVSCHDLLTPLVYSSPLFMLAGHVGALRGVDSDRPQWEADYLRLTRRPLTEKDR